MKICNIPGKKFKIAVSVHQKKQTKRNKKKQNSCFNKAQGVPRKYRRRTQQYQKKNIQTKWEVFEIEIIKNNQIKIMHLKEIWMKWKCKKKKKKEHQQ